MPPLPISIHISNKQTLHLRSNLPSVSTLTRRIGTLHLPHVSKRSIGSLNPSHPLKALSKLIRRQNIVAIPTTYAGLNSGPAPGTVVGIVLGSVAGFLLLLWLIYTCFNMGGGARQEVIEREVIRERRRSRSRSRSRSPMPPPPRPRSMARSVETRESPRRAPPPIVQERIIVEERRSAAPPPPPVIERDDDIVEVIEEHDEEPRRTRSNKNRNSGYRTVDPDAYAGGNRPVRKVSRR
ncbi:MAG: hypothetical protein M1827_007181 [Pycnora praestabilis]|nr:MAG: hypothetical protein M1827_007181 [Pycnora praestabilis]